MRAVRRPLSPQHTLFTATFLIRRKDSPMKTHQRPDLPLLRIRHAVRVLFFTALMLAIWQGVAFTGCTYLQIGWLRLVCPVGFLEFTLSAKTFSWELFPGFLLMIAVITLVGRAYCSWMCPASFIAQKTLSGAKALLPSGVTRFFEKKVAAIRKTGGSALAFTRYDAIAICVGLAVGICLAGYPAWSIICPVGLVSRTAIDAIVNHQFRMDIVFVFVYVLIGMFQAHGWKCMCPLGTAHGLLSTFNRTLTIKMNTGSCTHCRKCSRACPLGLEPDAQTGEVKDSDCIKCLECLNVCPKRIEAPKKNSSTKEPAL